MPPPVEEGRSSRSENATEFLPNGGESVEFLLSPPSSPLPRSSKSLRLLNDDDRELSGERLPNILACGVSCRNAPPVARLPSPADARDADANDSRWLPPFELARPLGGESPGVPAASGSELQRLRAVVPRPARGGPLRAGPLVRALAPAPAPTADALEPLQDDPRHRGVSPAPPVPGVNAHRLRRLRQRRDLRLRALLPVLTHHVPARDQEQLRLLASALPPAGDEHRLDAERVRYADEPGDVIASLLVQRAERDARAEGVPRDVHARRVDALQTREIPRAREDVVLLALAHPRPLSRGRADASEIESQRRRPRRSESTRYVDHQRVVHPAPDERVRVAHHHGDAVQRRVGRAGGRRPRQDRAEHDAVAGFDVQLLLLHRRLVRGVRGRRRALRERESEGEGGDARSSVDGRGREGSKNAREAGGGDDIERAGGEAADDASRRLRRRRRIGRGAAVASLRAPSDTTPSRPSRSTSPPLSLGSRPTPGSSRPRRRSRTARGLGRPSRAATPARSCSCIRSGTAPSRPLRIDLSRRGAFRRSPPRAIPDPAAAPRADAPRDADALAARHRATRRARARARVRPRRPSFVRTEKEHRVKGHSSLCVTSS
eukprot:30814-Pelagococcus_subviridis.AAC.10